jgi:hypothetical protein
MQNLGFPMYNFKDGKKVVHFYRGFYIHEGSS